MKLYIIQGPPASGKTTKAYELYSKDPTHRIIVNRDSLRRARGDYWVPAQEHFISQLEEYMVRAGFDHKYTVIIDATNLNKSVCQKWEQIAKEYGADIHYVKIQTPYDTCVVRDMNTNRTQHVGEAVIKHFFEKYNINKETGEYGEEN